jgi:hypothetical protein
MFRSLFPTIFCVGILCAALSPSEALAQQAYGRQWEQTYNVQDLQRFYNYPYVYYPHNYYSPEYFRSGPDPYNRYPAEMRVPAYNKDWLNYYPSTRRYHSGNHFRLDIF